MQNRKRNRR